MYVVQIFLRKTNKVGIKKAHWYFFHVEAERYRIASAFWPDQCLYAAERRSLSKVSLRPCSDAQDTTWTVLPHDNGYTIRLDGSELFLTIPVSTQGEARDETRWRCGSGGLPADGRTD